MPASDRRLHKCLTCPKERYAVIVIFLVDTYLLIIYASIKAALEVPMTRKNLKCTRRRIVSELFAFAKRDKRFL